MVVAIFLFMKLGELPDKIATKRHHPQADAINVVGWFGVLTMGLLWPLAIIWAYTKPDNSMDSEVSISSNDDNGLSVINKRLDSLEK